ncbi:amidohydrolase family protein [Tropicimonas sp. TH_r6]|uniref:amidohydrolase n=1 Tax=Tropicimonas sp. TH_r6 TaxID=3082085 RepID=UPI0029549DFA|nr:amidohydrolase family protein [Tropicimonas sp. TH_r6]MDV7144313.1 amidohydrolase family protein [Tropicimonas sp. TH_r6]
MRSRFRTAGWLAALLLTTSIASAQEIADTIYEGGPILTMNDAAPRAEALAVKDGRILAVGPLVEMLKHQGDGTELRDLDGKTLLPGFVDAHGHVMLIGLQAMAANMLPAPDGEVNSVADLQRVLTEYAEANAERVKAVDAIIGFGYDDSQLAELRHPTRDELDAVSTEYPVYILHQSGHIGVANSKALELAGFDEATEELPGGVIRREEGSNRPNGVLEETPHFAALMKVLQHIDADGMQAMFRAGVDLVASYGYTTAQEGRATTGQAKVMQATAGAGEGLPIDVVTYPDVLVDRDYIAETHSREYTDGFRVGGAKLTIDGSPQGFTAWRDRPYYNPPSQFRADYRGYHAASPDQVFDAIDWAFDNDIQILTHSNGEAASDLLLAAIETAEKAHGMADRRPVLIHGQFLREDQVDALNRLEIFPSLFPMHTFYWGDWHRDRTVGPVLSNNISPTGWVLERGMRFSTHHDAPVAFPDSMRVLSATVSRRSRSSDIIGPEHRVDPMTALKAMTIWPAWQHFEETEKGSLEPGKLADLVILSQDPTAIDPETINSVQVVQTIKRDEVIYDLATVKDGNLRWRPGRNGIDTAGEFYRKASLATEIPSGLTGARKIIAEQMAALSIHSGTCVSDYLVNNLSESFEQAAKTLEK